METRPWLQEGTNTNRFKLNHQERETPDRLIKINHYLNHLRIKKLDLQEREIRNPLLKTNHYLKSLRGSRSSTINQEEETIVHLFSWLPNIANFYICAGN